MKELASFFLVFYLTAVNLYSEGLKGPTPNQISSAIGILNTSIVTGPDCNTGCDFTYNNHNGNITIYGNNPVSTICITGTFDGKITVYKSNVTVRICGDAESDKITLTSCCKLILTD